VSERQRGGRTASPSWSAVVESYGVSARTTARLVSALRACEASALAFCRLLEAWSRGEPRPVTAGQRQAALRRAAERAETALAALERPLDRFLIELEADGTEGRPWYGEPGPAELVEWEPVLRRAGVAASPHRVALAYLELAVLVRALEGLTASARFQTSPDRTSLWAGLFDLRENLGEAADELRALAA